MKHEELKNSSLALGLGNTLSFGHPKLEYSDFKSEFVS